MIGGGVGGVVAGGRRALAVRVAAVQGRQEAAVEAGAVAAGVVLAFVQRAAAAGTEGHGSGSGSGGWMFSIRRVMGMRPAAMSRRMARPDGWLGMARMICRGLGPPVAGS